MLAFACAVCERLVTFESNRCLNCGSELGFDFAGMRISALGGEDSSVRLSRCVNAGLAACNWLVSTDGEQCFSCALTRTRPNNADEKGLVGFAEAEDAKRRLVFDLASLNLPIESWKQRPGGLAFDLLSSNEAPVTTGHADGVITLDLDETDPAQREHMRMRMGEPYRTVLGHFRHEIGHYYEPLLAPDGSPARARFRERFGDEREDYQEALDRHYRDGPPADWKRSHVSAYATMHPWEDFAETFAHYLHIRGTLQTAAAYGVRVDGPAIATTDPTPLRAWAEERPTDVEEMLDTWVPMTYALNAISRSMGESDLYPFVLGPAVEAKLALIDGLIRDLAG